MQTFRGIRRLCPLSSMRGVLVASALALAPAEAQERSGRVALIVAIGAYPSESGYPPINTSRDIDLVAAALSAQGFSGRQIRVLRDSEATKPAIVNALTALARDASPGDAVVFHYSGHGHRITDDGLDELDGLDEVLVPYGAPATLRDPNYTGALHLRDDELGRLLTAIRSKVGAAGSVTVFLDACYSGSATRGPDDGAIRGVPDAIRLRARGATARGGDDEGSGIDDARAPIDRGGETASLGSLTVYSAARHDQVARETVDDARHPVGSLSMALGRALPRLSSGATNRALFDRLRAAMAAMNLGDQQPQAEGALDAEVFSGRLIGQQSFYRVAAAIDDTTLELLGGSILGILPGTVLAFHPPGTAVGNDATLLATGTVVSSTASRAMVGVPRARELLDAWVMVSRYGYGDHRLRVGLDTTIVRPVRDRIRSALSASAQLQLVERLADVRLVQRRDHDSGRPRLVLIDAASRDAVAPPLPDDASLLIPALEAAIRRLTRAHLLRVFESSSEGARVQLEVMPTEPRLTWRSNGPTCSSAPPRVRTSASRGAEGLVLSPRDEFTFRLSNLGSTPAYVVVLEIFSDGRVNQVYPLPDAQGSDNLLPPSRDFVVSDICYFAEEPFGRVIYKLFASAERLDFSPLLLDDSPTRGAAWSPLPALFDEVVGQTRGATRNASLTVTTFSVSLRVVPRKPVRPTGGPR